MKNIKLTEEHRVKLLEMCNVLFPESKIEFTDDYYYEWTLFLTSEDEDDTMSYENRVEIHWFEFCMTNLSIAIYRKLFDFSSSNGYITADTGEEHSYEWSANFYNKVLFLIMNPDRIVDVETKWHPVDYLYEEFLKLN